MNVSAHDRREAADKAEAYYERIEELQGSLYDQIQSLLDTTSPARALLTAFTEFDAEFSRVQNDLSDLHRTLGTPRNHP